jgi:BirA family transcriptional regulator, biotin operon repressor / biotin---[acetyl-CoA-carboxylase] ligase
LKPLKHPLRKQRSNRSVSLMQGWALECVDQIDSTQSELLRRAKLGLLDITALMAKSQSAGRGRSGKAWYSPAATNNLYLSMLLCVKLPIHQLSGLTLALGVAAGRAIAQRANVQNVKLKWPNDLWIDDQKLGGILVEVAAHTAVETWVVAGVGVNIAMPQNAPIDQAFTCLRAHGAELEPQILAQAICESWIQATQLFADSGFAAFASPFASVDALFDRELVTSSEPGIVWRAIGVNKQGALILQNGAEQKLLQAGEVSVRVRDMARPA